MHLTQSLDRAVWHIRQYVNWYVVIACDVLLRHFQRNDDYNNLLLQLIDGTVWSQLTASDQVDTSRRQQELDIISVSVSARGITDASLSGVTNNNSRQRRHDVGRGAPSIRCTTAQRDGPPNFLCRHASVDKLTTRRTAAIRHSLAPKATPLWCIDASRRCQRIGEYKRMLMVS